MEPTDEMVEAALRDWNGLVTEASDKLWDHWRVRMHTALRAALAVMPDQYRAGWIAGRDAAAEHVCGYCVRQNSVCADHIRNMEPPA